MPDASTSSCSISPRVSSSRSSLDRGEVRRAGVTALADDVLIERWHPSPIAGLPSFVIGPTTEHTTRIYQIRFDAMRARLDPVATLPFAGVSKRVGWRLASGTAFVLVGTAGTDRRLASWRSDDPRVLPAPADLVGAPSDIDDLVSADLDGDGRREVLVAAGAWSGFELRVLRETSGADDVTRPALELVASRVVASARSRRWCCCVTALGLRSSR